MEGINMIEKLTVHEKRGDTNVQVQLIGEIDINTSDAFRSKMHTIVEENECDIALDFEKLEYIDSTGLGVLVGVLKKAKAKQHNIYVYNLKKTIKKLFLITGLDKVFIIKE